MAIDDLMSQPVNEFEPGNVGQQLGFAPAAEELRERLGVYKKSSVARPKKNNSGGTDPTTYTRMRRGQKVPGWSQQYVDGEERWINKDRQTIKDFVDALLNQVRGGSVAATPTELAEMVNALLLVAEFSPLNAHKNTDDARLLNRLKWVCKETARSVASPTSPPVEPELESILDQLWKLARQRPASGEKTASLSAALPGKLGSPDEDEQIEFLLFKTGLAETERYRRVAEAERSLDGSRLYYAPYLTTFSLPSSVRHEYTRINGIVGENKEQYFRSRQARLEAWIEQLKAGVVHRDLYEQAAIEDWITTRLFQGVRMSPEEVYAQIEQLGRYLTQYPAYEIALCPYKLNFNFEVKAQKVIFIQPRREYPAEQYEGLLHIRLEGRRHVEYFSQLFNSLWDKSSIKGGEAVGQWLRERYKAAYPGRQ